MKTLFTCAFLGLFVASTAMARNMLIIVSPHQDSTAAAQQYNQVTKSYLALGAGDSLKVINGMGGGSIATLNIPNNPTYNHLKPKLKINQAGRKKLKLFFQDMHINNQLKGAIDMPRLMAQIARYSDVSDVLIMGNPLYDVKSNPAMSMASGLVPSDGYLLNTERNNVFRTTGFENRLKGLRFHWLLPELLPRQIHADAVLRFYHHFIHRQGGKLVSFSHDESMVLELLRDKAHPMPLTDKLEASGKLEMQAIRDVSTVKGFYNETVSHIAPRITDFSQPITLGIQWQGDVDLDIYAQPYGSEALSYQNVSSPLGKHYKDILTGHQASEGMRYETIEFSAVNIKTLLVAINLYSAKKPYAVVRGSLRVQILGKVYETPFQMGAYAGNKGADMPALLQGGADTRYSKRFSIMDILAQSEEVSM